MRSLLYRFHLPLLTFMASDSSSPNSASASDASAMSNSHGSMANEGAIAPDHGPSSASSDGRPTDARLPGYHQPEDTYTMGQLSDDQPSVPDGPLEDLSDLEFNDADGWPTEPSTGFYSAHSGKLPQPSMPDPDDTIPIEQSEWRSSPGRRPPGTPGNRGQRKQRNPGFEYAQEDINALRAALKDSNVFRLAFYFLDYILRAQTALFEQIHRQQQLPRIIASMSILCAILSAIYGLTMGMDHSLLQSVAAAIKLPILFVLTAVICIPSLYTFNVLLGQRFKFLQTVTLMVMTLGTTSILLASLAPIAFFFSLTTPQYSFLLLLHVSIFALCGVYGVQYLYRGCAYLAFRMEQPLNNLLLRIWIVIYGLVGMQLGWRLRPFVGSDGSPFQVFRPEQGGNFYIAVWNAISSLLGGG